MSMVSLRLDQEDRELFKSYAALHNMSLSELFRSSVLERIEDEYDLKLYEEAMEEYRRDPVTYSHEEVARMLGLD